VELRLHSTMAVKVSKVWPVEKYARFISDPQQTVSLQRDAKKGGGVWQVSATFVRCSKINYRLIQFSLSCGCSTILQKKAAFNLLCSSQTTSWFQVDTRYMCVPPMSYTLMHSNTNVYDRQLQTLILITCTVYD